MFSSTVVFLWLKLIIFENVLSRPLGHPCSPAIATQSHTQGCTHAYLFWSTSSYIEGNKNNPLSHGQGEAQFFLLEQVFTCSLKGLTWLKMGEMKEGEKWQ